MIWLLKVKNVKINELENVPLKEYNKVVYVMVKQEDDYGTFNYDRNG